MKEKCITDDLATKDTSSAVEHLEALREDMRSEIKQRIKQRDDYSVQLTITLAAILSIAATATGSSTDSATKETITRFAHRVLVAAPLVSIYFTVLILYSYRIHKILATYLRAEIEPELASLCSIPATKEWESYYIKHAVPGIRRSFFIGSLWTVCIFSPLYVAFVEGWKGEFMVPLLVLWMIYLLAAGWVTYSFGRS